MDTLARFQLKAEARRFALGYLWWVVEPLLYVAVFYVVFVKLLGNQRSDFLVFLAVGKLTFIWFSKSINQAAMSLVNNRGLIGQVNLPKHLFPLSIVQEGLYRQLAVFAFLLLFVMGSHYSPQISWFWLLPIAALQYLLIVSSQLASSTTMIWPRGSTVLKSSRTLPNAISSFQAGKT